MPPLNNFQKSCLAVAVTQALAMPISDLRAATITVDSGTVSADAEICDIYDAFLSANSDSGVDGCDEGLGADIIILDVDTVYLDSSAPQLGNSALAVGTEITLQGDGNFISSTANNLRIFEVQSGADFRIEDINLSNANVVDGQHGAAMQINEAAVSINNSSLITNTAGNVNSTTERASNGGAIFANSSTLMLNNVFFDRNYASRYGGAIALNNNSLLNGNYSAFNDNNSGVAGGAVAAFDTQSTTLTLNNSQFTDNTTSRAGGALFSLTGPLSIADSNFLRNRATSLPDEVNIIGDVGANLDDGHGGAVFHHAGDLTISDSEFTSNSAYAYGGGVAKGRGPIFNPGLSARSIGAGSVTIQRSSFSENEAATNNFDGFNNNYESGGALRIRGLRNSTHTVSNSTFTQNRAFIGGGIAQIYGSISIQNTTIATGFNGGGNVGGSYTSRARGLYRGQAAGLNVRNSVITHSITVPEVTWHSKYNSDFNTSPLCAFYGNNDLTEYADNFFEDDSCDGTADGRARLGRVSKYQATPQNVVAGSVLGGPRVSLTPPNLQHHVPLFDSPLLGGGDPSICAGDAVGGADQRDIAHALPNCTIGAIDTQNTIITVNSASDSVPINFGGCTLRDALIATQSIGREKYQEAKRPGATCASPTGLATIVFDENIFPDSQDNRITLEEPLPLLSTGVVSIQGPGRDRLVISGDFDEECFPVIVGYSGDFELQDLSITRGCSFDYGGIAGGVSGISSSIRLDRTALYENYGSLGGAISVSNFSNLYMQDSGLGGNIAIFMGGVNDSGSGGAIVAKYASYARVEKSAIVGNYASKYGGGVAALNQSSLIIANSTISDNLADEDSGGGVSIQDSSANILHTTISGNSAPLGGGMYIEVDSNLTMFSSIVSGNNSFSSNAKEINNDSNRNIVIGNSVLGYAENTFQESFSGLVPSKYLNSFIATSTDHGANANMDRATPLYAIIDPLDMQRDTFVHPLVEGSPAINNAASKYCPEPNEQSISLPIQVVPDFQRDQNGQRRDGNCDIGSFEFQEISFFIIRTADGRVVTIPL